MIKSYKFWVSLSGALGILAVTVGKLLGYDIQASGVEEIVMAICGVLVVLGVVAKPNEQEDDKQSTDEKEE